MSNEHPDMSGSGVDDPFVCSRCGEPFREQDGIAVAWNDEVLFCSNDCAAAYEERSRPDGDLC